MSRAHLAFHGINVNRIHENDGKPIAAGARVKRIAKHAVPGGDKPHGGQMSKDAVSALGRVADVEVMGLIALAYNAAQTKGQKTVTYDILVELLQEGKASPLVMATTRFPEM
jgi:histone H3/H4